MASQSRDEPHDDSAHAHANGSAKSSEFPRPDREVQDPAGASEDGDATIVRAEDGDAPAAESLAVEDEELIEMLEQLNETLDSARIALSEHPNLSGLAAGAAMSIAEANTAPAPEPPRQSLVRPMLAVAVGICLGAGTLAMLWPVWKARQAPDLQAEPAEAAPRETRVSRSMQVAPPAGSEIAAVPLPEPRPALKPIRERVPQPAPRIEAVLAATPHTQAPMMDVAAASAAAPAARAGLADKPDFEEKDASNSMPVPDREPEGAALPKKPPQPPALTSEEEAALMSRGEGFLDNGDFASARLVYEHAAMRGSVKAMFALARSYDPRFLKEKKAVGIRPDRKLALDWYARAAKKGHDEAEAMASELERMAAQ